MCYVGGMRSERVLQMMKCGKAARVDGISVDSLEMVDQVLLLS